MTSIVQTNTLGRKRKPTVLIHLGSFSLSKKAFQLGAFLAILQILDGILTLAGLGLLGIHMEGNTILRMLMNSYGCFPALFVMKSLAILVVAWVTIQSHHMRWVRSLIALASGLYLTLAIFPWVYIISSVHIG